MITDVLARITDALSPVPGVVALTLGGSRATGTADEDSDIDIGVYYDGSTRPPFDRLLAIAAELDDHGSPDGHGEYGAWGPWVDGGIWLHISGYPVDLLLRNANRVQDVVDDCLAGHTMIDYQVGHPHGFCNAAYAGEVAAARLLHDPDGVLHELRRRLDPYPDRLAEALIAQFGFEAEFSVQIARKAISRGDTHYVAGCVFRAICCLNQVLFAANRRFLINEKAATLLIDALPDHPDGYRRRIDRIYPELPTDPVGCLALLDDLCADVLARTRPISASKQHPSAS